MEKLLARAARIVAARAEMVADRLVEAARAEIPADVEIRAARDQIILEGKALARRAVTEAALRGLSALARAVLK